MTDHGEPFTTPADASEPRAQDGTVAVDFRMAADHIEAEQVHLVGDFNDWSKTATPMVRSGRYFVAALRLATGRRYRYKFLVDGERWENDWNADAYVSNEYGGDDSVLDLTSGGRPAADPDAHAVADPDSPGAAIDDVVGEIPEPNEPA